MTYVIVSPGFIVTVGSLAIAHFPSNLRTALFASETLLCSMKNNAGKETADSWETTYF